MLTRLARLGEADLALALHRRLVIAGVEVNSYHDAPVLAALASGGRIGEVLAVLRQAHESGRPPLPVVGMRLVEKASDAAQARTFVDACADLGLVPDLPLLGALLKRYADEGDVEGAEKIYRELTGAGHEPDDRIFACMIRAHAEAGDLAAARRWLDDARRFGITPNRHHYAQVMVAARGNADELAEILRDMVRHGESPRSDWHWRVMSSAPGAADTAKALWLEFVEAGSATPELAEGALEVLATSQDADGAHGILDWLAARGDANGSHYLAAMRAAVERPGAVPRLMQELEGAGLEPEPDHYLAALEAATKVNDAQSVEEVLASLDFRAADPRRASLGALALGRSGNMSALEQLIADAAEEVPSDYWQALIVAYGISRQLDKSMSAYRRALSSTTAVDSHVYRAIIEACSDLGRPELTDGVLGDALRADLDTESLVVLHNLAIRSYSRAQRVTDCERIKLLMEERGLPVDRYTLGPIQSALERAGALRDGGRRLHGADSEHFRELGVILSDVVHELHQPVGIIGPAAGRARRALNDGRIDDARDAIDRLVDVSQEIADRINTYLQLTEGSEGDRTFDLRHAIEVAVGSVRQFAARSDVRLIQEDHVNRHADMLMRGSQFVVQLAIRGLLMNAIQAIAGATERLERRQVAVRLLFSRDAAPAEQRAGWADIFVSDTGPGIPEEIRMHIFERGFTTKSNRGLGLGLGMVQSAAESHGGYATHLEEVTQGAELWLRLPIVESGERDRP